MARIFTGTKKVVINHDIFRAYDIRGVYPGEINEDAVFAIAKTLGRFWRKGVVVIGRDARLSSPKLYKSARRGLKEGSRLKIFAAGIITTPMLSFLVGRLKARGGLMITASHNPKEYNGIKIAKLGAAAMSGKEAFEILKKFR